MNAVLDVLIIYLTGFKKMCGNKPIQGRFVPASRTRWSVPLHNTHNMANIHKSRMSVKYTSHGNAALQSTPGQLSMGIGLQPCPYFVSLAFSAWIQIGTTTSSFQTMYSHYITYICHLCSSPGPLWSVWDNYTCRCCATEVIALSYNAV